MKIFKLIVLAGYMTTGLMGTAMAADTASPQGSDLGDTAGVQAGAPNPDQGDNPPAAPGEAVPAVALEERDKVGKADYDRAMRVWRELSEILEEARENLRRYRDEIDHMIHRTKAQQIGNAVPTNFGFIDEHLRAIHASRDRLDQNFVDALDNVRNIEQQLSDLFVLLFD